MDHFSLPTAISALPTGLLPVNFSVSETAVDTTIGEIECLGSEALSTTFSITNDTAPFLLHRIGNSNVANLVRTTDLDYDRGQSVFEFTVTCSDSTGDVEATIRVTVLPENEDSPTYEVNPPIIISETTAAGTVLASQRNEGLSRITVSDSDRGEDGRLSFRFDAMTDDAVEMTHFIMNETDGTITLRNTIDVDVDFQGESSVTLNIFVCDGDRPTGDCTYIILIVTITSVNEFNPTFSQSSYTTLEAVYSEGEYSEQVIASVNCTDSDVNIGAFHVIQLVDYGGVPLTLVVPEDGTADVVLNGTLDYEVIRTKQVKIQLVCLDNGVPARNDTASISLYIEDLDDNFPIFSNDTYNVIVKETESVDTQILNIQCSDADYGEGALVGTEIVRGSRNNITDIFHIDRESGEITLGHSLDYDSGPQHYEFRVVCRDSGGNEAEATVSVDVVGVNDEPVKFTESEYHFTVRRLELPGGLVVGTLETEDRDLEPGQQITYSIEDNPNFDIDSSGQVLLEDYLLFLEGDHFRLTVSASDGEHEAAALVIVAVDGYLSVLDIVLIIAGVLALAVIIAVSCCLLFCYVRRR